MPQAVSMELAFDMTACHHQPPVEHVFQPDQSVLHNLGQCCTKYLCTDTHNFGCSGYITVCLVTFALCYSLVAGDLGNHKLSAAKGGKCGKVGSVSGNERKTNEILEPRARSSQCSV